MNVRWPSPALSAILAIHSSTSPRALVRPLSRSSARVARVGAFGMDSRLVACWSLLDSDRTRTGLQTFVLTRLLHAKRGAARRLNIMERYLSPEAGAMSRSGSVEPSALLQAEIGP